MVWLCVGPLTSAQAILLGREHEEAGSRADGDDGSEHSFALPSRSAGQGGARGRDSEASEDYRDHPPTCCRHRRRRMGHSTAKAARAPRCRPSSATRGSSAPQNNLSSSAGRDKSRRHRPGCDHEPHRLTLSVSREQQTSFCMKCFAPIYFCTRSTAWHSSSSFRREPAPTTEVAHRDESSSSITEDLRPSLRGTTALGAEPRQHAARMMSTLARKLQTGQSSSASAVPTWRHKPEKSGKRKRGRPRCVHVANLVREETRKHSLKAFCTKCPVAVRYCAECDLWHSSNNFSRDHHMHIQEDARSCS